jgi:hypothetical protein
MSTCIESSFVEPAISIKTITKECASCLEEISSDKWIEYRDSKDSEWKDCQYCYNCIQYMLATKWGDFITSLEKINCEAEYKRIVASGPPVNLRDPALKCDNNTKEVYEFKCNQTILSAKLKDSYVGSQREELCQYLEEILVNLKILADQEAQKKLID